ncbi:MAG: cytochrome c3 family protein [Desulfuromonadales bacterium]
MKPFLLIALLLFPLAAQAYDPASGCVQCHGDAQKMRALGAEALYLDPAQVDREVNMKGEPTCVDCHLGDATALEAAAAHQGMLRPLIMVSGRDLAGEAMERPRLGLLPLLPGEKGPSALVPKPDSSMAQLAGVDKINGLHWHDRDPERFSYRPDLAQATCGQCHRKSTEEFNASGMGRLHFQRANRSFAEPLPGPHNCGAWFGDNLERLAAETTVPFSAAQAAAADRNCNQCHPGCNDCHFKPYKGEGRHLFGQPEPVSCYGGQRGVICHAGPMERRRGAGFIREDYAYPGSLYAGAHREAGLNCLDCHSLRRHDPGSTASPQARASCRLCHADIVAAVESSEHAQVDCASCHIDEVGGYQFTFWGPGAWAGVETPYAKHAGYFGIRDWPTLIRNPEGRWLPYKPYPMAVLNQKHGLEPTGVVFRAIPSRQIEAQPAIGEVEGFTVARTATETNDAFIITGTRSELPGNGKTILWIQMDKISHALGYGRDCEGCHASHAQRAFSTFRYGDSRNVSEPFTGSYQIVADEKGLRFENLKYGDIKVREGRRVEDFAPFVVFPEAWNVEGMDLSLPFDEQKYQRAQQGLAALLATLQVRREAAAGEAELLKKLAKVEAVAYHNLAAAQALLPPAKPTIRLLDPN